MYEPSTGSERAGALEDGRAYFRSISLSRPNTTARAALSSSRSIGNCAEGPGLRMAPEGADPIGAVEVREAENVEEFGASCRREGIEALAEYSVRVARGIWGRACSREGVSAPPRFSVEST
jgi:hypothetical protein